MTRFTTMELHHANNEGKKEMLYGIELDHSDSKNYMGYSLQLAARDLSHRQDRSLGALDETRNSSVGPLWEKKVLHHYPRQTAQIAIVYAQERLLEPQVDKCF